jgi:DNA-binding transcriptional regulator YiaG
LPQDSTLSYVTATNDSFHHVAQLCATTSLITTAIVAGAFSTPLAYWGSSCAFSPQNAMMSASVSLIDDTPKPIQRNRIGTQQSTPETDSSLIKRLHDSSGLTWEQFARAIGVSRRSAHMWVSGSPMSSTHRERIAQFDALLKSWPNAEPEGIRTALLTIGTDGMSPYDRFRNNQYKKHNAINGPALNAAEML